jgi:molybdate transport system substrate-binding protein
MRFVSTVIAVIFTLAASTFVVSTLAMSQPAHSADLKVISGGAFKQVLNALAAQYEKESGNKIDVTYRTVGQHVELIEDDKENFDVAILTPDAIAALVKDGKIVAGSNSDLAKTGVGVVVKQGAPLPDISTVDAFKKALLSAKSVAYIDPKAGGSSGIYVGKLLEQLGIADAVNAKAVLVHGGAVATQVADGEAEIGVHQISEILPVKGAVLVGPLPAEIQSFTTYAAGVSSTASNAATASEFVKFLTGTDALPIIKAKGMQPAS